FRVDVLLAGVNVKSRIELIGPGEQLSVTASQNTPLGTQSVNGLLVRDPSGTGQATLIVAVVPSAVDQALDSSLRDPGQLISAYDVRAIGVGDGDVARITFTYLNDNNDTPTITYFDRKTHSQKPILGAQILIDQIHHTITVIFNSNSTPRLQDLNGTVFTISVPFTVQSNGLDPTLVQTQSSTTQASVTSSSSLFEGTSGSNLQVAATTSRTSPTGSGGGAAMENETQSGGGGGVSESGPLRELPQGPAALMALPSVTV